MTTVLIGAPVYDRAWILPDWFHYIEQQDFPLDQIGFVFIGGPGDESTMRELWGFYDRHPEVRCFDVVIDAQEKHEAHVEGFRSWPRHRYQTMANLRNQLLDHVMVREPDRFFSLDTDILLQDPTTITQLVRLTEEMDAVSPLMFMKPDDIEYPNFMTWLGVPGDGACRRANELYPYGDIFEVDVIMAAVMMTRRVYLNTRYQWNRQGEDLGWSTNCAFRGYKLFLASHLYTPHIMSRKALKHFKDSGDHRDSEIRRVGTRKEA